MHYCPSRRIAPDGYPPAREVQVSQPNPALHAEVEMCWGNNSGANLGENAVVSDRRERRRRRSNRPREGQRLERRQLRLSPVRFQGGDRGIAAISRNFYRNAAAFLCIPDCMATVQRFHRHASSADKVKSVSPNHRLLIALRSPDAVVETGPCVGASREKLL